MKNTVNISVVAIAFLGFFLFIFSPFFKDGKENTDTSFAAHHESSSFEANLKKSGIILNTGAKANDHFLPVVVAGNLAFLSGHGPRKPEGGSVQGKVGKDLTIEEGYHAARLTMIALLSSLREEIGSLDRVKRIVKVHGMVNCTADFTQQPAVINGATAVLTEIFGDMGKPARAAVGMGSLPSNIAVEIEMIVELQP
ncbi:MAG: RidA family protein [Verrucomicrobia bacterium]|nr:RidA family protein [Verrucomicrobiota bacterium]MDA1065043.1 RidA family protein [Verrucomicrobiota bacterium]